MKFDKVTVVSTHFALTCHGIYQMKQNWKRRYKERVKYLSSKFKKQIITEKTVNPLQELDSDRFPTFHLLTDQTEDLKHGYEFGRGLRLIRIGHWKKNKKI